MVLSNSGGLVVPDFLVEEHKTWDLIRPISKFLAFHFGEFNDRKHSSCLIFSSICSFIRQWLFICLPTFLNLGSGNKARKA